jgi:ankyrin repeat protein
MPPVDEGKEEERRHWEAVQFRGAVERGDLNTVDEMILEGFVPTYKMTDGCSWSVLMIASYAGHQPLLDKFTKGGRMPKVEEKDPNGFEAIGLASLRGHAALCQTLLDKKADANAKDKDGETSLMKAAAEGHLEVVKLLLAAGADPDALDRNDMSAIKKAARWGHKDCMMELLPKVKDDPRQLKHCLLFGRLNGHQEVEDAMAEVLAPPEVEQEAIGDEGAELNPIG